MCCFQAANFLLPNFAQTDAQKWAVVACDQFTSQPDYWERASAMVDQSPSTLRMILPEYDLSFADARIPAIHATMKDYQKNILKEYPQSMIFVERKQSDGTIRRGIVGAIDLEDYSYEKQSTTLIRATEETVSARIPPRVALRRGAPLESSHVMLLIDDPEKSVIEPLYAQRKDMKPAYKFDLMAGGGRITGRFLTDKQIQAVQKALENLITPDAMKKKYGNADMPPLLFAVGDGNHSLASAKAYYEEIKAKIGSEAAKNHPARYAMAEIVNLHTRALQFEPIHRVLFGVDSFASSVDILHDLNAYYFEPLADVQGEEQAHYVRYQTSDGKGVLCFCTPPSQLTVGVFQTFIDRYLAIHEQARVDYIHGVDSVEALTRQKNTIGFLFYAIKKDELFRTVMRDGALPRKTFSMGHAEDKRYYLECRAIL